MITDSVLGRLTHQAAEDGVQKLVVGAVVVQDDAVLLLKRRPDDFMGGIYELPSGNVESEETLDAATARELSEETGLTLVDIVDYIGSFDYDSSSGRRSRQFTFLVTVDRTERIALTEHDAYLWAPLDGELPVTEEVKKLLVTWRKSPKPGA
ncbi:NUDIX hydrolase [Amycolatopsis sp. NPDC004079]|uniref:NUDIX hydrolase n=1 Tax=Amycolatopsis sp. NPDC004079 TaxID=3154549 RepID=UPI0033B46B14